jgi:glycosyltransferase involved in cell wall biosynthesis
MGGAYSHITGVIRALSQHFNVFLCTVDNEVYKFELEDVDIKYINLIKPNLGNDFKDILFSDDYYLDQLEQIINNNNIDIIYERMCLGNTSCAQISRKKNITYIAEYNGSEIDIINDSGQEVPFENTFRNYEIFNFMNADIISVVSKQVKDQILDFNIPSDKIIINPNGADPKKLSKFTQENFKAIRESLNISKNDFVIGYVGTFSTWHNIDFLMKLINFICKKNHEIKFILIGLDYTNKNFLKLIENNKKIKSQLLIMGKLPPKVKDYFLKVSDATIITNKNKINNKEFFGSPIKLFEYMSLGKPIISTKVKNIEEYLEIYTNTIDQNMENVNGFIIDNEESTTLKLDQIFDKFYNVINFLKLNAKISNKIGENGRNHFLKKYTWEANINKLIYTINNEYK